MDVRKTLCRLEDIPDGGAIAVDLPADIDSAQDGYAESLILLRRHARVFAYRNTCPHAGNRLDWSPGQFLFEGSYLICAAHGAMFAVASGECVSGPCRGEHLGSLAVEVLEGGVYLV